MNGNIAENWRKFKQRFSLYCKATGADEKESDVQCSLLLHLVGAEALEIYNGFQFDPKKKEDPNKLDDVIAKFEAYCNPKKNLTYVRYKFFTCSQKADESIDHYVSELQNKAKDCEFSTLKDSLIRDRVICGITSNTLRERLLREDDLKLEKAVTICRAAETTKKQVSEMKEEAASASVHYVQRGKKSDRNHRQEKGYAAGPVRQSTFRKSRKKCQACGYNHPTSARCPAVGQRCRNATLLIILRKCAGRQGLVRSAELCLQLMIIRIILLMIPVRTINVNSLLTALCLLLTSIRSKRQNHGLFL